MTYKYVVMVCNGKLHGTDNQNVAEYYASGGWAVYGPGFKSIHELWAPEAEEEEEKED